MFLSGVDVLLSKIRMLLLKMKKKGEAYFSPGYRRTGASFSLRRGSLTVEAALILPVFLFCMITMLQFVRVMESSVRLGSSLAETGKQMAVAAYLFENPDQAKGKGTSLAVSALTAGAAHLQVRRRSGDLSSIQNDNLALSRFLGPEQEIDLVLTCQVKAPFRIIPVGHTLLIQRCWVRAWTGRPGSGGGAGRDEEEHAGRTVFIAENASVYHDDPECTHLSLSIRPASRDQLTGLRNAYGGKYHACEKCGDHGEGLIYITNEGDCYHTSLGCSGLKRTVSEVSIDEVPHLHACSRCGKEH